MMRPIGSALAVAAGLAIALALTGCGRFENGSPAEPASPVPSATASADTMDNVLGDLEGADDALTQVESDVGAGDTASGTNDAP